MRRRIDSECGMTLAEVLVAVAIIAIGLLALLSTIPLASYATQEGSQTSTATFLANQRLEQVRNAQWSATPAVDTLGVSASSTAAPLSGTTTTFADESPLAAPYTTYTRQVRITDCGTGAGCTGITNSGMRLATVTVSYTPLSATGTAGTASRSVAVSMVIAQR